MSQPAGTYGTNVISLIGTSNWTEETQLNPQHADKAAEPEMDRRPA